MSVWPRCTALFLLVGMAFYSGAPPILAQPAPSPGSPPATASWPHTLEANGATVVVYQPQVISWPDRKTLNARAAIAITALGSQASVLGTLEVAADTETDLDRRLVFLTEPRLISSRFPTLDTEKAAQLDGKIKAAIPNIHLTSVPLDAVLLSLGNETAQVQAPELNNDPPVIFYSSRPASLVVFDGEPVLVPLEGTPLSYAVNTNWTVFTDSESRGMWYLLNSGAWLQAAAYSGPYAPAAKLPAAFQSIPKDAEFAEVRKSIPGLPLKPGEAPAIFVSTKPAEVIVTQGAPAFTPIPGTSLRWVKNSNATLILDTANGAFYYLVSGRWFSAPGLNGPWAFATDKLPRDFARIPPNGPAASVRASIPGTSEAQTAVLQSQIPREATLKREAAKLDVAYVGPPQFKPIAGTQLSYAVNTPNEVIEAEGRYYACYQGAWFVAPSPEGPWALADSVAAAIYHIPPSSPLYNLTYVTVYSSTPASVTYGYTAAI